jgi:ribonucleoside-diphosphate reductase alpha chain
MSKPAPEVAPVAVEAEMSSEEYRAMVELAKNSGPDDCEMWVIVIEIYFKLFKIV